MKYGLLVIFCLCNTLGARPYIQRFWKPIIFKEEHEESFDRKNLIPIEEGEYKYKEGLPEVPETVETVVSAGNVSTANASFVQQELSADNIIKYLKENERHSVEKAKPSIDSIYVTPVRKINLK